MSQENVEIVCRGIEALNRRDIDAWLEGFQPDVESHDLPTIPDAPVRRGHEDLRRWVGMMGDTWRRRVTTNRRSSPPPVTSCSSPLVPTLGGEDGAPVEVSFFWVFEMRDGKVQRSWAYFDEAQALKAAGLSE